MKTLMHISIIIASFGLFTYSQASTSYPREVHCEVEANRLGIKTLTMHSINSLWSHIDEVQTVTFIVDQGLSTEKLYNYVGGNPASRFPRGTGTGALEYVFADRQSSEEQIEVLFLNGTRFNTDRLNRFRVKFVDSNVGFDIIRNGENNDGRCGINYLESIEI